jgi:CRISPR-associated endonuclease/helicase Cas3
MHFRDFFQIAYPDSKPYPYQEKLAQQDSLPVLLDVATGLGKTAAILGAWCYRRFFHPDEAVRRLTPRRLVYVLPIRVLSEQTFREACRWRDCVRHLAKQASEPERARELGVALLMGGEQSEDWDRWPEREGILVGTQDMILSRALNRGYAMNRYRWPMHFGLLNNDVLYVADETQLMGPGVTTTAQLQGLREKLHVYGPSQTIWMSATLDEAELDTVDHPKPPDGFPCLTLGGNDLRQKQVSQRIQAKKGVRAAPVALDGKNSTQAYAAELAAEIAKSHREKTLTLVVVNRVERAQAVFQALAKHYQKTPAPELVLIHARFRPQDRQRHEEEMLAENGNPAGRIVVATQAIEAGIDLSATTLWTELAPWPSLVQRFGRCNRRGECGHDDVPAAKIYWIDIAGDGEGLPDPKIALPYDPSELRTARECLAKVTNGSPESLRKVAYTPPARVVHTLRKKDLLELWDTTPDLAGNDLDVSRFIRDSQDTDVQFYWRDWDLAARTPPIDSTVALPAAEELCAVRLPAAKDFLRRLASRREKTDQRLAWLWDSLTRQWMAVRPDDCRPGCAILLHKTAGGYAPDLGWTGDSSVPTEPIKDWTSVLNVEPEVMDNDGRSYGRRFITIAEHTEDVVRALAGLQKRLAPELPGIDWAALKKVLRWHDAGKAHPCFQKTLLHDQKPPDPRALYAKAPRVTSATRPSCGDGEPVRRGFRHELAAAVAYLIHHRDGALVTDLIAFLIVGHHGKIRVSIRCMPNESRPSDPAILFARGIWEGDRLPKVELGGGETLPETVLDLSLMRLGDGPLGPSWLARAVALRDSPEFGPFRLALLETLVRIADWRGSEQGDQRND